MSYFANCYSDISYPVDSETSPGLRNAQLGAIHAIAAHFSVHSDPALVVMPTGSGKTAVLLVSAYVLRPERTLVITPSRLVRSQIAAEAREMETLRRIRVLSAESGSPQVLEVTGRLGDEADWKKLEAYDLVVGTPNSMSPGATGVAPAPSGLFDLVLVDEAHHSPAHTWEALLRAFPNAKVVLFTATPFRLDEKEIHARCVYEYPLGRALDDGIICQLEYQPVEIRAAADRDAELARRAERVIRAEQLENPTYRLLVRTDRRTHAKELERVYGEATALKLRTVHSGHTRTHVMSSIKKLRSGELDGIISVDMLGEGFDFPPLKVAAIHRKHKSLAVTLQFVGRFGRVTRKPVPHGATETAKILAVPEELEGEIRHLYEESTAWQRVIPALHDAKSERDRETRAKLDNFKTHGVIPEELQELSMWGLEPFAHVKIYEVQPDASVDVSTEIDLTPSFEVVYRALSPESTTAVFLTREAVTPRWSNLEIFDRIEYDLFVVHWNIKSRLLFISASRRGSIALYERIAKQYTGGRHRILPLRKINRVLRELDAVECFNLGMRNRQRALDMESYRIVAGANVDRAVRSSDGRLFNRGHVFAKALDGGEPVTLGYSSSSKVWRGEYLRIPELVSWCQELAIKITDERPVATSTGLDHLPVGEVLHSLPDSLLAADWDDEMFLRTYRLAYLDAGEECQCSPQDGEWTIDRTTLTSRSVTLQLQIRDQRWPVEFSIDSAQLFSAKGGVELPSVCGQREVTPLNVFLNQYPLKLYTADFSLIQGTELSPRRSDLRPFDIRHFVPVDWKGKKVDIKKEFGWLEGREYKPDGFDKSSIHGYLVRYLLGRDDAILFYDHETGEIADFVSLAPDNGVVRVHLYHVKASGGTETGNRMNDAYEVCGQVVKSLIWLDSPKALYEKIERRSAGKSFFLRGDLAAAKTALEKPGRQIEFHIALVQPAFTVAAEPKILQTLAAADDYVRQAIGTHLVVFGSAETEK